MSHTVHFNSFMSFTRVNFLLCTAFCVLYSSSLSVTEHYVCLTGMASFLQRLLLPEACTSSASHLSTFPAGCLSLSRVRVCLGAANSTRCQISSKKTPLPPPGAGLSHGFFFFLAELYHGCSKAARLKSAVWSVVITSGVRNPSRGVGV